MRKRISIFSMALLLSGCASTSVDYIPDATGENTTTDITSVVTTTEGNETQSNDLDSSKWKEKIEAVSADGHKYTFTMNAEIIDPEEEICIYEFETIRSMTPEQKKQMAEGIFGVDSVYLYDYEYKPKLAFENERERITELLATDVSLDSDTIKNMQEYIDELNMRIEAAPADLVKADDFSGNRYSGYINGLLHTLEFIIGDEGDVSGVYSDTFSYLLENNSIYLGQDTNMFPEGYDDAKYRIPADEAKAQSEELMKNMGFEDFAIRRENRSLDYSVEYVQGLGCENRGLVYSVPPREIHPDLGEPDLSGVGGNSIQIHFNYNSITAWIKSPYYVYDVTKDVQLISLKDIKDIIRDEFTKHPENYIRGDYDGEMRYTKLKRSYIEVASDDTKRVSMVPCWALYSPSFQAVFVNAIDGTIIENMLHVGEDGTVLNP